MFCGVTLNYLLIICIKKWVHGAIFVKDWLIAGDGSVNKALRLLRKFAGKPAAVRNL